MKSLWVFVLLPSLHAFLPSSPSSLPPTALKMGLFDGVKEAFGADGMGDLEGDRETPIDRWMGWNAKSSASTAAVLGSKGKSDNSNTIYSHWMVRTYIHGFSLLVDTFAAPLDFVDSMDSKNYLTTTLSKPMGIVFEENDSNYGGVFVLELTEGSQAAIDATLRVGDQLVAVGSKKVSGLPFEEALGAIIDSKEAMIQLVFFRGPAKFLYGPTGASQEWLEEFVGRSMVKAQ